MNDPKVLFVKKFLATLSSGKVSTIPINNNLFNQGIDKMAEYFSEHREQFGPYVDKLELLFLKYSTKGDYRRFADVIEGFNGRLVSLENPHYVKANIKMEKPYIEELVQNDSLGLDESCVNNMVEQFCIGAEIDKKC